MTRWGMFSHSDSGDAASRVVTGSHRGEVSSTLVDRRFGEGGDTFAVRNFATVELERLMGFPDGYTSALSAKGKAKNVLGNSIVVPVARHIWDALMAHLHASTPRPRS